MMMWRTRISVVGVIALMFVLAALLFNMEGATAAPLPQIPPTSTSALPTNTPAPATNTPVGPTETPFATITPQPSDTPVGPTPPANTPTSIPSSPGPRRGGGGGAPPGPSGTPVVNGCVKSIGRNGISLSAEPGFYQPHVQIIPRGQLAQVLSGPQRADNIWWWRLRAQSGAEGWGNQDEMTPDPGPCAFGGSVSPGQANPPYPVTILPAAGQAPVQAPPAQVPPPQAPPPQATSTQQETLPQTGGGLELWFLAGLLVATMIGVGLVRRRLQAQPAADVRPLQDDETESKQR